MKPGVLVVNTARAELLDDAAVLEGLTAGIISGLATDVFHTEPPEPSPRLAHDNVVSMPHAGGLTQERAVAGSPRAPPNSRLA